MEPRDFVYWLQGLFELTDTKILDEKQVAIIKEHLALVFDKKTSSSYGDLKSVGDSDLTKYLQRCFDHIKTNGSDYKVMDPKYIEQAERGKVYCQSLGDDYKPSPCVSC